MSLNCRFLASIMLFFSFLSPPLTSRSNINPKPSLTVLRPPLTLSSLKHTRLRRPALHFPKVGSVLANNSYDHHLSHLLHPPQPLVGICCQMVFSFISNSLSFHICLFVLESTSAGKLESSCLELSEAVSRGNVTAPICVGKILQ